MTELPQTRSVLVESLRGAFDDLRFTVIDILRQAAQKAPHKPAILEPDRESLTYRGLLDLAETTVGTLQGMGLVPTSRVALALATTAEATATYAALAAGLAIIPMNPGAAADEAGAYLKQARAAAVVVQPDMAAGVRQAAAHLGLPVIEIAPVAGGPAGRFTIVGASAPLDRDPQFAQAGDLAVLLPTSGTTSLPKLAPQTQEELTIAVYSLLGILRSVDSVIINMAPLYHGSGLYTLLWTIIAQAGMTTVPTLAADQLYRYLARYQAEAFFAVPSLLQVLVNSAPQHEAEIRQLRTKLIAVSSASLPEPLFQAVQRIFGATVYVTYGTTETYEIASTVQSPENPSFRPGSVGKPLPTSQVRIADEDGTPLPAGIPGEILVRTPLMIHAYENNPAADAAAFHDGWFRTGDIGYLDAAGYLYLTGRIKEVINRGGSKISPLEVDAVLAQHPAVVEAATFGFPHAALGEDLAAAVVVRDPGVTERDLRRFAAGRLPMTQVPSRFVFVSEIPKTALGKVRRGLLADQFRAQLQR